MGIYAAVLLVLTILLILWIVPVGLWLQAIFSIGGKGVTIFSLIGMRFRRVPPSVIVNGLIATRKAGIDITSSDLEVHYMAGFTPANGSHYIKDIVNVVCENKGGEGAVREMMEYIFKEDNLEEDFLNAWI